MKKILFITYYWPPSGGAGVQRGLKFVKYLPGSGVQPVVLTVDPRSASYPVLDASLEKEVASGLHVVRTGSFEPLRVLAMIAGKKAVPHAGFAGSDKVGVVQRLMRWVRGNMMIPDARRGWVRHAVKAAVEVVEREGIDTIVITSPPHSSQLIGLELKKRYPAMRWIADLRDPWTDIYYTKELMKGRRARQRDADWEARVMHTADAVVVVGPATKRLLAGRYGEPLERKLHVIPNGYDRNDIEKVASVSLPKDVFTIAYVGTMAASYEPRPFFDAVSRLRGVAPMPMRIRFIGSAPAAMTDLAAEHGISDLCIWVPNVPHDEAVREMASAHVLLLVVPKVEGEEHIIPGKLFEYLGVQRPILGLGPVAGDVAAIIAECDAGHMFARDEVDGMAEWLSQRMVSVQAGDDGRITSDAYMRYERRAAAERLAQLIGTEGPSRDRRATTTAP
jgi:glycosyltransferase involved in cell wall biosynthesis